jgi:hypothetical protein
MSASNNSSPAEFATLLLRLGFAQLVVLDFLSNEQGIKMVDDLKIIPVLQMTPTYTTLTSASAAFNIRKIQSAKAVIAVTQSSGSTQTTGTTLPSTDVVVPHVTMDQAVRFSRLDGISRPLRGIVRSTEVRGKFDQRLGRPLQLHKERRIRRLNRQMHRS